jgi:phenylpropionate dioxygenase-like ring-hydroxylating dioxygenase large terminal subunit
MQLALNRWYAIFSSAELPAGRTLAGKRLGLELVAWRDAQGKVSLSVDRCPHRGVKLSPGRVIDGCVECPFHGFRFDGGGACTAIPAHPDRPIPGAMSLTTIPARDEHGLIWAWVGSGPPPDGPIPFFDFKGWSYTGSEFIEPVACHYTRAVENQLDMAHLPFVHRSSIGRGMPPAMDVLTEVDGDAIHFRSRTDPNGSIDFLGPNVWRLNLGFSYGFLVMAPVDDHRMVYYSRAYQRSLRWGPLAWLMGAFNRVANRFILRQDSALVESHAPGESRLRAGEVLVPSDGPIIAYRRWREALRGEFDPTDSRRRRRIGAAGGAGATAGPDDGDDHTPSPHEQGEPAAAR